jgi:hypothetical protein
MQVAWPSQRCDERATSATCDNKKDAHQSVGTSSSRSIDEIVLDLLRGKVAQCCEALAENERSVSERGISMGSGHHMWGSQTRKSRIGSTRLCACKFLVIIDVANAPQYWLVNIKNKRQGTPSQSTSNYLNCIDSIELYASLDDVCEGVNRLCQFSNKNWFLFEALIRFNVQCGVDVLLDDFMHCSDCAECHQ